jgi:purine-nucleoside phosphorylase
MVRAAPPNVKEKRRQIGRAAAQLAKVMAGSPRLAIVLGTGFGSVGREVKTVDELPYRAIPGFAAAAVPGHEGKVIFGTLAGAPLCLLSGRIHYYEGHSLEQVTFPMRVLAELGIRDVLLTNAAGAIKVGYRPGDFMALRDHINLMGANPLRGSAESGQGFVDLTCTYEPGLRKLLRQAARKARVVLHEGVYAAVSGPSYETPAEIRAFARLGADAVGMSTVPEAIVARACGMRVAGLSCLTNPAAGKSNAFPSHADVLAVADRVKQRASALLHEFAVRYGDAT